MFGKHKVFVIAVGLMLVAAACGGGDSSSDTQTSDTSTTTTTSGGDGGSGASDTTTTTAEQVSGDSGSTWCDRIREAQDNADENPINFNFFGMTPEQLEAQFETNLEIYEEWADIAPSEIDDDVDTILNAFRLWFERASALEWDFLALAEDAEFIAAFEDAAVVTAANNIDAYNRDVCGVDFTSIADPGGPPTTADVGDDPIAIALNAFQLPASLLSEDDIECLREQVGPEFEASITPGWVPGQDDITVLLAAVEACEIGLVP